MCEKLSTYARENRLCFGNWLPPPCQSTIGSDAIVGHFLHQIPIPCDGVLLHEPKDDAGAKVFKDELAASEAHPLLILVALNLVDDFCFVVLDGNGSEDSTIAKGVADGILAQDSDCIFSDLPVSAAKGDDKQRPGVSGIHGKATVGSGLQQLFGESIDLAILGSEASDSNEARVARHSRVDVEDQILDTNTQGL